MEEKSGETKSEESEHESEEDESEILEESPTGRWLKRSEEVSQRNVPGIDRAYLAMDSEEGVEVVWNEVQFSERKSFRQQEEKIKAVFDNLMRIDHANIVKFHRYWIDYAKEQQKTTRVVFITEYMSSGSVKEFLNKTKDIHKYKRTKSWKRWCTQILSALSYLHNCVPPVIHGNMTCDTIFIQHNGLVKIGSVAPDAIRNHVKTYHEIKRNMHYYAPEYGAGQGITPAVDIYSFGICALEMAVPRSQLHYKESKCVTEADIERAIDVLDDPHQSDFIRLCLRKDPNERPSARSLLLHPVLFEVHSLKLVAAHAFVKNQQILPEYKQKELEKDFVIAEIVLSSGPKSVKLKDVPAFDVDKFLEDVKNGVYPLTSFALPQPHWASASSSLPSQTKGLPPEGHTATEQVDEIQETRRIIHAQGTMMPMEKSYGVILQLRFEDKTNRHLNCEMLPDETAEILSSELVQHRLIKETDKNIIKQMLEEGIKDVKLAKAPVHFSSGQLLGGLAPDDIPPTISTTVHPAVTPTPIIDSSYQVLASNLQKQILPKTQIPISNPTVGLNPLVANIPGQPLQLFQSAAPSVLAQPISAPVTSLLPQTTGQIPQHGTLPHPQLHLPQPTMQPLSHLGLHTLQQQYLPQPSQQAALTQVYLQYLQQQAIGSNPVQTATAIQPTSLPQTQSTQAMMMQQLSQSQGLYLQQQPILIQQSQPQVVQQTQRHVHFQSTPVQSSVPSQNPTQATTSQMAPTGAVPTQPGGQHVVPVVFQQPQLLGAQTPANPTLMQPQARIASQQSSAASVQRTATGFLHHQQPQTQSTNNSNNIVFSQSTSKVDDNSVGGNVPSVTLQQVTPHSSIASVASTASDHDSTSGTTVSPIASSQAVQPGGGGDSTAMKT